jgi:hypothetical protein
MIFNAVVVNHSTPAISVQVADSNGVTYNQIKQSLGNQVYDVKGLYLYSANTSQLIGTLQYQIYESNGNQKITSIPTVVNPYQNIGALLVDLNGTTNTPVILNGQSSISTTIYPQTYLQVKFLSSRVTNAFGNNLANFRDMERITNTKFFENYGDPIKDIQDTKKDIVEGAQNSVVESNNYSTYSNVGNKKNVLVTMATFAAVSVGAYLIFSNE